MNPIDENVDSHVHVDPNNDSNFEKPDLKVWEILVSQNRFPHLHDWRTLPNFQVFQTV